MLLKTLGGLELEGSGFARPKPLLLLAYLALEGAKSRRELAELFWREAASPRDSLSTALRRLNAVEPELVVADGPRLSTGVICDAKQLLLALESADELEKALGLYEGAFLAGLDLSLGEELEEWVYTTRERLAQKVQRARLQLAERQLAGGDAEKAVLWAEQALDTPGAPAADEALLTRLARLLERGGSPRLQQVLSEAAALGLALEPAPRGTPSSLPALTTSFVGRQDELAQLDELLNTPHARLITLHGPGGVGKSRLAAEAARRTLDTLGFPDGVFFVPLEDVADAEAVPAAVAEAMGVGLAPQRPPLESLLDALGAKHVLLVLDNYEHLAGRSSLPGTLVRRCPNLRVIVTSRVRLQSEAEHVLPMAGLSSGGRDQPGDAAALFLERARKHGPAWEASGDELADVQQLCALVHGFPLAIELAAAWLRVMPLAEIAAEIRRDLDFLKAGDPDTPERQRSLRATFELSWRLLGEAERRALRRLAVFRGGFRRDAAEEIAGVRLRTLAGLLDKALVRHTREGRYERHPLIHQFTEEKLAQHPEEERRYRLRHAEYFLKRAVEEGADGLAGERIAAALGWFDEELANLRAAWSRALEDASFQSALKDSAWYLVHYAEQRARLHDVRAFFEEARRLAAHGEATSSLLGEVLGHDSWLQARLGQNQAALESASEALRLLEPYPLASVFRGRWSAHEGAMLATITAGDFAAAAAHTQHALSVARSARAEGTLSALQLRDAEIALGVSYSAEGTSNLFLGDFEKSRESFLESRRLLTRHRCGELTFALYGLGQVALATGDLQTAVAVLDEGHALARQVGLGTQEAEILCELARAHYALGDLVTAQAATEEGLETSSACGNLWSQLQLLSLYGRILLARDRAPQALETWRQCARLALGRGLEPFAAESLVGAAEYYAKQGRREEARSMLHSLYQSQAVPAALRLAAESYLAELGGLEQDEAGASLSEQLERLASSPGPRLGGLRI